MLTQFFWDNFNNWVLAHTCDISDKFNIFTAQNIDKDPVVYVKNF